MALALVLTILAASCVQLALWDDSDYLLLVVPVSGADIDIPSSEVTAAEHRVHLHLYDCQAIFLYAFCLFGWLVGFSPFFPPINSVTLLE